MKRKKIATNADIENLNITLMRDFDFYQHQYIARNKKIKELENIIGETELSADKKTAALNKIIQSAATVIAIKYPGDIQSQNGSNLGLHKIDKVRAENETEELRFYRYIHTLAAKAFLS